MVFGFGNKALLNHPSMYATEAKGASSAKTKSYDYVIVGCGTAGSVLASRLSEDPNVSVLVVEAGGDQRGILETKVPLTFSKLFHGPNDWDYATTAQKEVQNRELYWPRGKLIGGSSSMNAMMHHHCSHSDFDEWERELGCKGWGYSDIQPYMRRSEKFTPNKNRPTIDLTHRGDSGLWQTGYSYLTEIGEKGFLQSCVEVGIPENPDINTPNGTCGATRFQTFIDSKGQRSSAATAYLPQEVINRKNLDIAVHVRVSKVRIEGNKAVGVELQSARDAPFYHVNATKEVILCGGTINTPQTLKLSGIGPKEELQKHGIKVVKDLPAVGENMKDHFCTSGFLCKAKPGYTLDYLSSDIKAIPSLVRWLVTGGGPVTSNVGEVAAFIRSVDPPFAVGGAKPKDYGSGGIGPDIEIIGAPLAYVNHGADPAPAGMSVYSLVPIGLRPQSKGSITLKSSNVFDAALIDPKYWTDADDNDRKVLLVGLRVCMKIIKSAALGKYLEPVETNDDPESYFWPYSASDIDAVTDDQLRQWMGKTAFTLYHPVGSARMGQDASNSVVDLQCRVHGIENLRVVDASIMPEQISGHPTAPIIAIAEKMSDVIRGVTSSNGDATKSKPLNQQGAPLTSNHTSPSQSRL